MKNWAKVFNYLKLYGLSGHRIHDNTKLLIIQWNVFDVTGMKSPLCLCGADLIEAEASLQVRLKCLQNMPVSYITVIIPAPLTWDANESLKFILGQVVGSIYYNCSSRDEDRWQHRVLHNTQYGTYTTEPNIQTKTKNKTKSMALNWLWIGEIGFWSTNDPAASVDSVCDRCLGLWTSIYCQTYD